MAIETTPALWSEFRLLLSRLAMPALGEQPILEGVCLNAACRYGISLGVPHLARLDCPKRTDPDDVQGRDQYVVGVLQRVDARLAHLSAHPVDSWKPRDHRVFRLAIDRARSAVGQVAAEFRGDR